MTNLENKSFFVRLNNSKELKKTILESIRGVIVSLQEFEKLSEIKKEKINTLNKLSSVVKEIEEISDSLNIEVPGIESFYSDEEKKSIKENKKNSVKKENDLDDLEKLEASIAEIERKLNSA